jgi:hypothetical protein
MRGHRPLGTNSDRPARNQPWKPPAAANQYQEYRMTIDDFHDKVLSELSDLKGGQSATTAELRNVVARQDKVNGSVARHEEKLGMLQLELSNRASLITLDLVTAASEVKADLTAELNSHVMACPMKPRMDVIEDYVVSQKTKAGEDDTWMSRLWPVIYAGLGMALYLVLLHAAEMLKIWKQ